MDLNGNTSFDEGFYTGSEKESGAWAVGARIGYLVNTRNPRLLERRLHRD